MFGPFELPKWHLSVPFYILKAGIHIHFFSESSAGQVSLMAYLPGFNLGFWVFFFWVLTFSHWARWWRQQTVPRALTICTENPEIPGRIQMERFFPVEIFRKKSNTFRGITFFPFLPKWPKFSVPFVLVTSARLHVERKWEIYRYFVNGTTQSRSCFRCQKKTSTNWGKIFTDISVQW